jgi:hypothetical protein
MGAEVVRDRLESGGSAQNAEQINWASHVAANWAAIDAPSAADWVRNLPEGEARDWAARNLALHWARYDEAAARAWASGYGSGETREAVLGMIGR